MALRETLMGELREVSELISSLKSQTDNIHDATFNNVINGAIDTLSVTTLEIQNAFNALSEKQWRMVAYNDKFRSNLTTNVAMLGKAVRTISKLFGDVNNADGVAICNRIKLHLCDCMISLETDIF